MTAHHSILDARAILKSRLAGCDADASPVGPHFKIVREPKEIDAQRVATDVWHLHDVISESIPSGMHITDLLMNLLHMRSQRG